MHFKKAILLYRNVNIGGSETLLFRIGKQMILDGTEVFLLCNTIDSYSMNQFAGAGFNISTIDSNDDSYIQMAINKLTDSSIIISLSVHDFFNIEIMRKKNKVDCKNILYVVHPFTLYAADVKYGVLGKLKKIFMKFIYIRPLNKYLENGNIIFMDEQCFEHSAKFYGFCLELEQSSIVRLPIDITDYNEQYLISKCNNRKQVFHILTVARASFPFKGYMKGLIEIYSQMGGIASLTIVADRDEYDKLECWVNEANSVISNKINLIHGATYSELNQFYEQCHVYIGMGTTILEAADKGAVCIPVAAYTYECNGDKLFSESPQKYAVEINEGVNIKETLNGLIQLNDEDFYKLMVASRKALKKNYSADGFIEQLYYRRVATDTSFTNLLLSFFIHLQGFCRRHVKGRIK